MQYRTDFIISFVIFIKITVMKIYLLLLLLVVSFSCQERNKTDEVLQAKNKTIDSLKAKLEDCTAQAKIMAEVLEEERVQLQNKKATD